MQFGLTRLTVLKSRCFWFLGRHVVTLWKQLDKHEDEEEDDLTWTPQPESATSKTQVLGVKYKKKEKKQMIIMLYSVSFRPWPVLLHLQFYLF